MTDTESGFEGWAILDLMGHRRLGGKVSEATIAGAAFVRIDVPHPNDSSLVAATKFYSPQDTRYEISIRRGSAVR